LLQLLEGRQYLLKLVVGHLQAPDDDQGVDFSPQALRLFRRRDGRLL